jgi:DNA-binding transcriptional regulator YdaS (Cro superfamily)
MNKLLEQAIEAARHLPPERQESIARTMLDLVANEGEPGEIDPEHLPDVLEGLEQARRRHFVSDVETKAIIRRLAE